MKHEVRRLAGNEEVRNIIPAVVLGSALWSLLLVSVALKETAQSDVRQAAAAHHARWPERYGKHALDRRNVRLDAPSVGHSSAQPPRPIVESSMETMLLLSASD